MKDESVEDEARNDESDAVVVVDVAREPADESVVDKPVIDEPASDIPALAASEPEVRQPEVPEPEALKPEVLEPEALEPEVSEPVLTPGAKTRLMLVSGLGEILMTLGAVLGLYVVYLLWWTNIVAHQAAHDEANKIQQMFTQQQAQVPAGPGSPASTTSAAPPTVFSPGQGFALMTLPAINIRNIPVMQGTDKEKVLNKGAIGHYTDPVSAMPWDATGNFAVAAHRRTGGEPFRYINRMVVGDHVVVETARGWYIYVLDQELPQTSPANIGSIAPIPVGGPYTKPGQYITLTTCTPEWASTYRLIWWGHLERTSPLSGPVPPELAGP